MSEQFETDDIFIPKSNHKPKKQRIYLHIILFIATFITATMAGAEWMLKDSNDIANWGYGIKYSILIIIFISFHEFGHYFAAKRHKVDSTLPFYIPMAPSMMPFGTMGAVIKTRSPILSRKALFDIGVAGPLAGFAVAIVYLVIGFVTLPSIEYLYEVIPEYQFLFKYFGAESPSGGLYFGDTILFSLMASIFANPDGWLPPMNELIHYPFLNVGWFGLFVTALNMLPIGQLDGGHVTYAMFGKNQWKIAKYVWIFILFLGIGGLLGFLHSLFQIDDPDGTYIFFQNMLKPFLNWLHGIVPWYMKCWQGWLFWALITRFFIKLKHPPVSAPDGDEDIGGSRKFIGWLALLILLLTFSYNGIYIL